MRAGALRRRRRQLAGPSRSRQKASSTRTSQFLQAGKVRIRRKGFEGFTYTAQQSKGLLDRGK